MNVSLRATLAFALFGSALVAQTAQEPPPWPGDARAYRVHMIGNAHVDPVWLWPWQEGLSVVQSTFRSALDRMNETPDFVFTASSAQFYQWVSENDPAMLAEIRKRVDEGRWALVGGWWVEPDLNMSNGESLIRQGLYGQLTLRRLLGRTARIAYNPDSFGHPGTLPQILRLQGMNDYIFMRPEAENKTLPANLFWWESPDGSRTLAYRIPISYLTSGSVRQRVHDVITKHPDPSKDLMVFFGAGDHGGGATKENIRSIEALQKETGAPTALYSSPERYFDEVRKKETGAFPVHKGDLQHFGVGCYTALSAIKKLNRNAEIALQTAEKVASVGALAWGADYPASELESAWKRVLLLQFHDSLSGTSLPEHYERATPEGYGYANEIASRALDMAAQKLAWQTPATDPESDYLMVFNPHAWPVTSNVEYDLRWPKDDPSRVEDEKGSAIPHQWARATTEFPTRQRLVARVDLPAFGYRQIRLRKVAGAAAAATVRADGRVLENERLRATFGDDGAIALFDKDNNRQVFLAGQPGARALVMDDPSDTWGRDATAYDKQIGAFGAATFYIVENGPVRATLRVQSTWGASTLTTEWILNAGARTLEGRVSLDWREQHKMVKLSFPVDVPAPRPTYEVAYGTIVRDTSGHEEPGLRWIDVTGSDGRYGLAVVNDAKYGYSVAGNDMRISVVRGAPYGHLSPRTLAVNPIRRFQDQGVQTLRVLLAPHAGSWQDAGVPRIAEEFTTPVPVVYQGIHGGSRPQSDSFLAVDARNVIVSVVKKPERGSGLILRCYETAGHPVRATIDLRFAKRRWSGEFRASEIKTLEFNPRTGEFREVNALEE
jgi:alpha-mannosidase